MRPSAHLPALTFALGGIAAACTDELAPPADPVVTITSKDASWAAVHVGDTWTRHDDLPLSFSVPPGGRYEVVVVCRTDIGHGWSFIGAAGESTTFDHSCEGFQPGVDAGTIPVDVQITGRVEIVFVGAQFVSSTATLMVRPGTYDVLAYHPPTASMPNGRVQLLRDVAIDQPRRIDIDLAQAGADLARASVYLDGAPTSQTYAELTTRTGAMMWSGFPARVLPPELARDTDDVRLHVRKDEYWADLAYRGQLLLHTPTEATTATFRWDPVPTAELTTEGAWDRVSLRLTDGTGVRTWLVMGQADVIAAEGRIALEPAPFPDWNPAWLPDPAAPHTWEVRWERARADGREGRRAYGP